jgi:hypothetical protein
MALIMLRSQVRFLLAPPHTSSSDWPTRPAGSSRRRSALASVETLTKPGENATPPAHGNTYGFSVAEVGEAGGDLRDAGGRLGRHTARGGRLRGRVHLRVDV